MNTKKSQRNQKNRPNRSHVRPTTSGRAAKERLIEIPQAEATSNELLEDRALFEPDTLVGLPEPLRAQAQQVIQALDCMHQGDPIAAADLLREIPRASPFADWRLFVRGLSAWYDSEFATAKQSWERLDPTRRPARIAAVLTAIAANAAPNKQDKAETDGSRSPSNEAPQLDIPSGASEAIPPNASMIQLVNRLRVERPGLRLARRIAEFKSREEGVTFTASQISMLLELREGFHETESELVKQVTNGCVGLAWQQDDLDTFKLLVKRLPGPAYDPEWELGISIYQRFFEADEDASLKPIEKLVNTYLAKNQQIEPKLRSALASVLYEQHAEELSTNNRMSSSKDRKVLKIALKGFEQAAQTYPANRNAYLGILDCIEQDLEATSPDYEPLKKDRDEADEKMAVTNAAWLEALPEDIVPRLWLIDYNLANDQPQVAAELSKKLPISTLEDLRVKMLPWKIKLTEAVVAAKKKRTIPLAEALLQDTILLWPKWLSQEFVPFLQAALKLRSGDIATFDSDETQSLRQAGLPTLVTDIMLLASAQLMSVESIRLKPLRDAVEQHVRSVKQISTEDLVKLGSFYWDLKLCRITYAAWRMHGSKFGMELCRRLNSSKEVDAPEIIRACLWLAEARFYASSIYEEKIPIWLTSRSLTDPLVATAILRSRRLRSYAWRRYQVNPNILTLVEQAVKTEARPVERLVMEEAIKLSHEILEEGEKARSAYFGDPFERLFGNDEEDTCMCPNCVARRARQKADMSDDDDDLDDMFGFDDDDDDDDFDDDDDDDDDDFDDDDDDDDDDDIDFADPSALQRKIIMDKIGIKGFERIATLIGSVQPDDTSIFPEIESILRQRGVSMREFLEVAGPVVGLNGNATAIPPTRSLPSSPPPPPPRPMTAEQRRRNDKQRRKMLNNSRKRK